MRMQYEPAEPAGCNETNLQIHAEQIPFELRLALARAVAAKDRAILLDPDNEYDGHASLSEAVTLNQAFAVHLRDDVLGFDIDEPSLDRAMRRFVEMCVSREASPIVEQSGREGHFHVFVRVPDANVRAALV